MPVCDAIAGCCGSRIRDYANATPVCPVLLIFAQEPSFSVEALVAQLKGKPHLELVAFHAKHGLMAISPKSLAGSKPALQGVWFLNFYRHTEQKRWYKSRASPLNTVMP